MRCKLSFIVLKSALLCLRGSRTIKTKNITGLISNFIIIIIIKFLCWALGALRVSLLVDGVQCGHKLFLLFALYFVFSIYLNLALFQFLTNDHESIFYAQTRKVFAFEKESFPSRVTWARYLKYCILPT